MKKKNLTLVDSPHAPGRTREEVLAHLRELILALDRRVPHLDRIGELDIARDGAALRCEALERIAELEQSDS